MPLIMYHVGCRDYAMLAVATSHTQISSLMADRQRSCILGRVNTTSSTFGGLALICPPFPSGDCCRAGVEGGIVVAKCENKEWGFGYNAANSEYCDLLAAGVLDPAKVFIGPLRDVNKTCVGVLIADWFWVGLGL